MAERVDMADVMSKIAHMREVSEERGFAPAEVEKAAVKMAEWMLRHNITHADIDRYAKASGRSVVSESYPVVMSWRQVLLTTVADAHMCKVIKHIGSRNPQQGQMTVIGHEHNLIVVRETWQWLIAEGDRLATEHHRHAKLTDGRALNQPTKWKTDFKMGFTTGIGRAYRTMQADVRESVGEDQWAIVPLMNAEVERAFDELFPKAKKGRGAKYRPSDSYERGVRAGEQTNLGRQVGGEARPAIGGQHG